MNRDTAAKWLNLVGVKALPAHRAGWVVCHCPLGPWRHKGGVDKNPSFGLRVEQGESFCSCFSCGWHGSQTELLLELRHLNASRPSGLDYDFKQALVLVEDATADLELDLDSPGVEQILLAPQGTDHVFPDWWLDSFAPAMESKTALAYLHGRDGGPVPLSVVTALDLRWDAIQRRVCFPVRDFESRLRGLHGRAADPGNPLAYRMYTFQGRNNPDVWLGESWVDPDRPVIIAESVFDLVRVFQCYRNVTTPLTASINQAKIHRASGWMQQFTLFDRDAAGKEARAKHAKSLPGCMVKHLEIPEPYQDGGEMSVHAMAQLLSEVVPLDGILLD